VLPEAPALEHPTSPHDSPPPTPTAEFPPAVVTPPCAPAAAPTLLPPSELAPPKLSSSVWSGPPAGDELDEHANSQQALVTTRN
jgi:hypothetical protein